MAITGSFQNILQYLDKWCNNCNIIEKPGSILSRINDAIKQGLKLEWNSKICQIHFFHQFHSNRIFLFLSNLSFHQMVELPPTMFVILVPKTNIISPTLYEVFEEERPCACTYVNTVYLCVLYYNISTWQKNDGAINL